MMVLWPFKIILLVLAWAIKKVGQKHKVLRTELKYFCFPLPNWPYKNGRTQNFSFQDLEIKNIFILSILKF